MKRMNAIFCSSNSSSPPPTTLADMAACVLPGNFPAQECAKNVALQTAAMAVAYLDKESVPASVLEEEKAILLKQMEQDPKMAGKPQQVLENIVKGKLGKYYENNCLLEQAYVKDDSMSVSKYVASVAKELGGSIKVTGYVRFDKGEGLEKREEDFAAEIAKMVQG